jgi:hypothetical protein
VPNRRTIRLIVALVLVGALPTALSGGPATAQSTTKPLRVSLNVIDEPSFVSGYAVRSRCGAAGNVPLVASVVFGPSGGGWIPLFTQVEPTTVCTFSVYAEAPNARYNPSWGAVNFVVGGMGYAAVAFGQSTPAIAVSSGTTISVTVRYGTAPVSPLTSAQVTSSVVTDLPDLASVNQFQLSTHCDSPLVSDNSIVVARGGPVAIQTIHVSAATGCSFVLNALTGSTPTNPPNAYVEIRRNGILEAGAKLGRSTIPIPIDGNTVLAFSIVAKTAGPQTSSVSVSSPSAVPVAISAYRLSMTCSLDSPSIDIPANVFTPLDIAAVMAPDGSSTCAYRVSALNGSVVANPPKGLVTIRLNGENRAAQTLGETSLPLSQVGITTIELVVSYPLTNDEYGPIVPRRLLDTRDGTGGVNRKLALGETIQLTIPPSKASALNVTVTQPQGQGFITVYPCGTLRPLASNLNFAAGQTTANLVLARPGTNNQTCLYTSASTHLLADLDGTYFSNSTYTPTTPTRVFDSRTDAAPSFPSGVKLTAGQTLALSLSSDPVAVVNVTVTDPSAAGFITVYPCGVTRPLASNVNFAAGQTAANLMFAQAGGLGTTCIYTSASTHLILDVNGHFPATSTYVPENPRRLIDTRSGLGGTLARKLTAGEITILPLGSAKVSAMNFTVTNPDGPGYLTAYPCGTARPVASSLNFDTGQTTANLVLAEPADRSLDRYACIYTSQATDLIVDAQGSFPMPTNP